MLQTARCRGRCRKTAKPEPEIVLPSENGRRRRRRRRRQLVLDTTTTTRRAASRHTAAARRTATRPSWVGRQPLDPRIVRTTASRRRRRPRRRSTTTWRLLRPRVTSDVGRRYCSGRRRRATDERSSARRHPTDELRERLALGPGSTADRPSALPSSLTLASGSSTLAPKGTRPPNRG